MVKKKNALYYGITDNLSSLKIFREIVIKMLFKILNRRTQKNKYSYEKFYNKIEKQIIKPKVRKDIVEMGLSM